MDINHCFSLDLSSLESIRLPLILILYRSFIISCSSALNLDFSLYFSRSMLNVYLIMSVDFLWFGIWWTRFYTSSSEEVRNWSFDFDEIVDQEHLNVWRTVEGTHFDLKLFWKVINLLFVDWRTKSQNKKSKLLFLVQLVHTLHWVVQLDYHRVILGFGLLVWNRDLIVRMGRWFRLLMNEGLSYGLMDMW